MFTRLTVLHEAPRRGKKRYWCVRCECGTEKQVRHDSLVSESIKSCGCLNAERLADGLGHKHGDSKTRLYRCYNSMIVRASKREGCSVFKPWLDNYVTFKEWALSNGYGDTLVLCRNGDVGNYEPNNCRWDTHQSNDEESNAKSWIVVYPDGTEVEVFNLRKFCRDNGLSSAHMQSVAVGRRTMHKGFGCKYLN